MNERRALFTVAGTRVLSKEVFWSQWKGIDNVYAKHGNLEKRKDGSTIQRYKCRYCRPVEDGQTAVPKKRAAKFTKASCKYKLKVEESLETVQVNSYGALGHSHSLDDSDSYRRPTVVKELLAKHAVYDYPSYMIKDVLQDEHAELPAMKFLDTKEVANMKLKLNK
jgi:hypothetical protein